MAMGVLGLATLGGILVTDLFSWGEGEQLAQPEVRQGSSEPVSELAQWNYTASSSQSSQTDTVQASGSTLISPTASKPGKTVSPKTKTKTK